MARLAPSRIGNADDGGFQNGRMRVECRFDLGGVDVFAAGNVHVLDAIDDVVVAIGVAPADVKLVYTTSGTSGRPTALALSAHDVDTWRQVGARSYRALGVFSSASVLVTLGAGPFTSGHTHGVVERLGARRVPVAPGDTERVLACLQAGLADTLLGTPSFALHLASVADGVSSAYAPMTAVSPEIDSEDPKRSPAEPSEAMSSCRFGPPSGADSDPPNGWERTAASSAAGAERTSLTCQAPGNGCGRL